MMNIDRYTKIKGKNVK